MFIVQEKWYLSVISRKRKTVFLTKWRLSILDFMNIFTVNSSDSILHMSTSSYGTWKRYRNNLPTCFNRNKLIHYYRNILKELCNVIFVKVFKQVKILVITIRKLLKIAIFLMITFKAKLSVKTAKIVWMKSDNLWHNEEYHIADWCKILIFIWNYIRMENGKLVDTFILFIPLSHRSSTLRIRRTATCSFWRVLSVFPVLSSPFSFFSFAGGNVADANSKSLNQKCMTCQQIKTQTYAYCFYIIHYFVENCQAGRLFYTWILAWCWSVWMLCSSFVYITHILRYNDCRFSRLCAFLVY